MISICIPTYNKPKELRRLLDSIAQQTYNNFEIIISDDTPDADSIKQVIVNYPQLSICYYHHDKPLGSPENWNFAIDQAHGEYIKLMHDDDWFVSEDALTRMVEGLKNGEMVFCQSKDIDANGSMVYCKSPAKEYVEKVLEYPTHLLLGNWIGAPSCVLHQKSDLRYDKNLKWFVDIDFYIMQILQSKNHISYVPMNLVYIGVDGKRVTNECITDLQVIGKEYFYCLEKYRKLHIISFKDYCYLIYCFLRDYKLKEYNDFRPYCNSILGITIFNVYKMRKRL